MKITQGWRRLQSEALSDEMLLGRCGRGDEAAFQVLFERYHRMVYNLAFRMTGNHADAEEITPEVFVKAWRKAGEFRGHSRVSTWIYRIAANLSMDRLRSARAGKEVFWEDLPAAEKDMPDQGGEASPEEVAMRQEDRRALANAMARLSPEDRLLVTLYHLQGCSYAEIEDVTGVSQTNIKSRLFRARRRLREHMESLQKGDAPNGVQPDSAPADGLLFAAAVPR